MSFRRRKAARSPSHIWTQSSSESEEDSLPEILSETTSDVSDWSEEKRPAPRDSEEYRDAMEKRRDPSKKFRSEPGREEFSGARESRSLGSQVLRQTMSDDSDSSEEEQLISLVASYRNSIDEFEAAMYRLLLHTIDMARATITENAHYQHQIVHLQEALEKAREEAAVERAELMRLTSEIAHFMPSKVLSHRKLIDPNVSEIAEVVPLPLLEDHHEDLN
ncbi:hypothetical protein KIN20_035560 [Parelaphostrongylus tenuis]|uniref:Uncharacterized protein n=1 Tax=Parelaphostrongylus tenuis TaxID=148309 RepID=A0AAD5RBY7_PARTN|nr:hypothetical protein KIN20_035560 [Parelaphostrongylus tenuis]